MTPKISYSLSPLTNLTVKVSSRCPAFVGLMLISVTLVMLSSCQMGSDDRANVLVIAVNSLKFDDVTCDDDPEEGTGESGFRIFCQEGVRFTHSFSPSTMTQPSLVSILTAKYPFESNVWENGSSYLREEVLTTAEIAMQRNYRTAFFSGGPPVWSRSGINQGFNYFVDSIKVHSGEYFRPASSILPKLSSWMAKSNAPFFAVAYLADLQFPDIESKNIEGVQREASIQGQISEIDEELGHLFGWMKRNSLWDQTHIYLVGTNGRSGEEHKDFSAGWNLFAENTLVATFIKPRRKKRDLGLRWNIDANISLADIGATIRETIGEKVKTGGYAISLLDAITELTSTKFGNRMIFIESGWPAWFGVGPSIFAIRKNSLLYFYDQQDSLYNSLLDRSESMRMDNLDPDAEQLITQSRMFFQKHHRSRFHYPARLTWDKMQLARSVFKNFAMDNETKRIFRALILEKTDDQELVNWFAYLALLGEDWKALEWVSTKVKRLQAELQYVSLVNQGKESDLGVSGCLRLDMQACNSAMSRHLIHWMDLKSSQQRREREREKFIRQYRQLNFQRMVQARNQLNHAKWFKTKSSALAPDISDLLLALPQNKSRKKIINIRLKKNY